MSKRDPKRISIGKNRYVKIEPEFYGATFKGGSVVNIGLFDVALGREAEQWVRSQLSKKRRVFRDEGDKLDFTLIATDIPEIDKLMAFIPQRFPIFAKRKFSLRELSSSEEVAGPLPEQPSESAEEEEVEETERE